MKKIIYSLYANGDSLNGWIFRMFSYKVFEDEKDAENYIPQFKNLCCDNSKFECAVPETLKIKIIELELSLKIKL